MTYKWESAGDQDSCIRKICMLGPYLLEHTEDRWIWDPSGKGQEVLIMASRVYMWNDQDKAWDIHIELPPVKYVPRESYSNLEDWYALNVLSEELFIGTVSESNKFPNR